MSRPTVKRFNQKKTVPGRTVKRTVIESRSVKSSRKGRKGKEMRPMRSY